MNYLKNICLLLLLCLGSNSLTGQENLSLLSEDFTIQWYRGKNERRPLFKNPSDPSRMSPVQRELRVVADRYGEVTMKAINQHLINKGITFGQYADYKLYPDSIQIAFEEMERKLFQLLNNQFSKQDNDFSLGLKPKKLKKSEKAQLAPLANKVAKELDQRFFLIVWRQAVHFPMKNNARNKKKDRTVLNGGIEVRAGLFDSKELRFVFVKYFARGSRLNSGKPKDLISKLEKEKISTETVVAGIDELMEGMIRSYKGVLFREGQ